MIIARILYDPASGHFKEKEDYVKKYEKYH
jgi:hypothetical protein